ncbi:MAG: antitoxin [Chlorobiaceae bacterium]|jgi:predicted DNA binding CopG/RHH family protein|nr:antitoxin [Chlorobiaceae bacterium]
MSEPEIEEQEILNAFEAGELKRVPNPDEHIALHRIAAEATFKKDTRINIRLTSRDLRALQVRAMQEGVPYQTFVSSVLHKYANGQFIEKTTDQ